MASMILSNKPLRVATLFQMQFEMSRSKSEIALFGLHFFATLPGFLVIRNNLMTASYFIAMRSSAN
jgi:hypothetical protein